MSESTTIKIRKVRISDYEHEGDLAGAEFVARAILGDKVVGSEELVAEDGERYGVVLIRGDLNDALRVQNLV